jgi:hypothetical protein
LFRVDIQAGHAAVFPYLVDYNNRFPEKQGAAAIGTTAFLGVASDSLVFDSWFHRSFLRGRGKRLTITRSRYTARGVSRLLVASDAFNLIIVQRDIKVIPKKRGDRLSERLRCWFAVTLAMGLE